MVGGGRVQCGKEGRDEGLSNRIVGKSMLLPRVHWWEERGGALFPALPVRAMLAHASFWRGVASWLGRD